MIEQLKTKPNQALVILLIILSEALSWHDRFNKSGSIEKVNISYSNK